MVSLSIKHTHTHTPVIIWLPRRALHNRYQKLTLSNKLEEKRGMGQEKEALT